MKKEKVNKNKIAKHTPKWMIATWAVAGYLLVLVIGIVFILGTSFFGYRKDLAELAKNRGEYVLYRYSSYPYQTFSTDFLFFNENDVLVVSSRSFLAQSEITTIKEMNQKLKENGSIYTIVRLNTGAAEEKSTKTTCLVAGQIVQSISGVRFGSFVIRELGSLDMTILIFAGIYTLLYATALILLLIISTQHQNFIQLQRDLVSNVSHELKTPITSIKAMGELIYDGMYETEEDHKRYARTILRESDKLKNLVGEILDLSRLQSNKVEFEKGQCHADGVFTPVLDNYMMMAGDLGIEMDTSGLELEKIPLLYTDHKQITKVWQIILDNAMKFAGHGGKITIGQQILAKYVVFSISDNGPGIKPEDVKRIFERFFKADVTHNSQGSGLGLSIAAEIIRSLDEKIWVESVEGEGSTFYFTVGFKQSISSKLLPRI